MRTMLLTLMLASLVSSPGLVAHQEDCDITQARVDAVLAEVVPALEEVLGLKLEDPVHARVCERSEIAQVVAEENRPLVRAQIPDEAEAERQVEALGAAYAAMTLAKYAWSSGEVLVVAENFPRLSELIRSPELCSDEALRAILVHELIHLDDHRRLHFDTVLAGLKNADQILAYNAVIEGHAQHLARRVCTARGWAKGFEIYSRSIGALPAQEDQGAGVDLLLKVMAATVSASYVQGERFFAEIEEAGGTEAVARAFATPPVDLEAVYHPEWFLDPGKRPVVTVDFEAAIALAKESFPPEKWNCAVLTVNPEQLRVATAMIPAKYSEKMLAGLVANRLTNFSPLEGSQSKQVAFVVYELRSVEAATLFVAGEELVMRAKDEQMKSGAIRISSAEYTALVGQGLSGVLAHKEVQVGSETTAVITLCASRGRMAIETTFIGEPIDDEEHIALAASLLRRAAGEDAGSAGELFSFEDVEIGAAPSGWVSAPSSADPTPNEWRVVEEARVPGSARVLALTTDNAEDTFNLLLVPGTRHADLELSVDLRANAGEVDRGGGIAWRARSAEDYWLARWNPLEQNVRLYVVEGGERRTLESAATELDAAAWHHLKIVARGARVEVFLDGEPYLSTEDAALPGDGQVGLWTKADASTAFDDLRIEPAR